MNEAAVRAYLLGKLTESEVELVESRLVEDPDLFSQVEVAEDDLFDAYARGELDADELKRFLERFGGDVDRRRFANAFVKRSGKTHTVIPFPSRRWMPLAVAATLLIGLYIFPWRYVQSQRSPAGASSPTVQPQPAVIATSMVRVPLVLGTSRAVSDAARITIDANTKLADLSIRLNPADRYAAYGVEVRSSAGLIIWGDLTLKAADESGDLTLHAVVPAEKLVAGSYEIAVRGIKTPTSPEDLGFLTIEVHRVP